MAPVLFALPAGAPGAAVAGDWVDRLDELRLLTPLRIVVVLLVAWLLSAGLGVLVRRLLRRTIALTALTGADAARAEGRQQALAAALRSALVGVIWAIAVITVVSEVGINIGAFVATATVIGGAVAFGAQQLMRDLIAGFFVLAEDQFGVGDEVDLGLAVGTVERISLRSARLRDASGVVWHVPHGGVGRVGNLSRASQVHVDAEVTRRIPLADSEAVLGEICRELETDAGVCEHLAGPPRIGGVVEVRDDRYVLRVVAPVRSGQHEAVRRHLRHVVLSALEAGRLSRP